jgi:hypothetical protein
MRIGHDLYGFATTPWGSLQRLILHAPEQTVISPPLSFVAPLLQRIVLSGAFNLAVDTEALLPLTRLTHLTLRAVPRCAGLLLPPGLEKLKLKYTEGLSATQITSLSRLRTLQIQHCFIKDGDIVSVVTSLTQLRSLCYSKGNNTRVWPSLCGLTQLTALDLLIPPQSVLHTLRTMTCLKKLRLRKLERHAYFYFVGTLPSSVRSLYVDGDILDAYTLANLTQLERLVIRGALRDWRRDALLCLTQLTTLELKRVNTIDAVILSQLPRLTHLTVKTVKTTGAPVLAPRTLTQLHSLKLCISYKQSLCLQSDALGDGRLELLCNQYTAMFQ